ncbi:MAG: ClpXP protease specificity-enhancing factor [Gammaproteobacteria bacterium]|nr:MAG: ClpXP protease specificity-enhancing factor [Gammaproteobacteria bacterium]RKZ76748.1 MAG: ClpXP protease specificity-enhancing factor [Gammaproteobacteria bacterium]
MISMRPYLLRALYDWIVDNGLTPHLLVNAEHEQVEVPNQYIENGQIILNISQSAVQSLNLDNDWVTFTARFSGQPFSVFVPVVAVLAIYAKENGKGMFFQAEDSDGENVPLPGQPLPPPSPKKPPRRSKPILRRVK